MLHVSWIALTAVGGLIVGIELMRSRRATAPW
jgi:hypothetical protein